MRCELRAAGEGRFELVGPLILHSVGDLLRAGERLFPVAGPVAVDLSGVGQVDSAGVALLLEWARLARHRHAQLTYIEVPERALALARIGNAEQLLPLGQG